MSGISLSGVTLSYNGSPVLRDVGIEVAAGEWVAVIGPNGAGKTTMLRAVAGTIPARGSVLIDGRPVGTLTRREAARLIAYVPQQPVVPDGMTALEYVLLGRTPYIGYWSTETTEDLRVACDALERLEAAEFSGRPLDRLSGGERQRVVLARALAQESTALLLDEPTTALDIGHQQHVLELVDGLRHERQIAVLVAFHDLTLAAQYADRLVLLDGGVVVADGPPRDVLTSGTLARFSGARVTVIEGPDGDPIVVPRRGSPNGNQEIVTSKSLPTP